MSTDESANPYPPGMSRRKSDRYPVVVPVEVRWKTLGGAGQKEAAQAREVSAHGGLLLMKHYPPIGSEVEVVNSLSNEVSHARTVALRRSREGAVLGLAVKLLEPSETFWGVSFQLKKTSAQLLKLEETIKSGGIDPRVLREFRDAVDHIRKTAWVVQEWQERQLQRRDAGTVLSLLVSERIRRAAQLMNDLAADLEGREVACDSDALGRLSKAVERLRGSVTSYLANQKPG